MVLLPLAMVGWFANAKASNALESAARTQAANKAKSLSDMISVLLKEEIKLADELSVGNTTIDVGSKVAETGIAH
jgi:methyl-accepting chemotaxis protein